MDTWVQTVFWLAFIILILFLLFDVLPERITEGFTGLVGVGDSKFWAKLVPRRGDVGPELEQDGLLRDGRYFAGYADVQRFGVKTDFCRMVQKGGNEKDKFIACALGGTENLSSTSFRSPSVAEGLVLGRDDYMRDVDGDGREDYCRIVKRASGNFRSECNLATDKGFGALMVPDNQPPPEIEMLLKFYEGCVMWLRLRDDMVDYAENLYLNSAGGAKVKEKPPRPDSTEGLMLNGNGQYLRIGDDPYLNFGSVIQLRSVRTYHLWVRFDEFTNNARIFDFSNGPNIDNVYIGIVGRGNLGVEAPKEKILLCGDPIHDVLPDKPSGAQPGEITTPQDLMETTSANVEEYTCEGFAVAPRKMEHPFAKAVKKGAGPAKSADLMMEIWDKEQRKMRVTIPNFFTLGEWTHVVVTAEGLDAFRPDLAFYKNGQKVFIQPSAWLAQNSITEKNYIGRSSMYNVTSQYANRDEDLRGAVFDIRLYNTPLGAKTIQESYEWGQKLLGIA